jgi:hypothetical protein
MIIRTNTFGYGVAVLIMGIAGLFETVEPIGYLVDICFIAVGAWCAISAWRADQRFAQRLDRQNEPFPNFRQSDKS